MLHEFAVDPNAVATWDSFRLLVEHFGVPNGRLISRLPKRWEDEVLRVCDAPTMEKHRITERLAQIRNRLTRKARPYEKGYTWIRSAEDQHAADPFQAIITTANPSNRDYILVAEELHGETPRWNVDRELPIPRQCADMAACVEGLFKQSKEILFADPHFTPERRFTETLGAFLQLAHSTGATFRRIEYHTLCSGTQNWFSTECDRWLPRLIPNGVQIKLVRWKLRPGGEDFHARYVLTDLGGLRFERGLDSGEAGQTTDVSLLDEAVYVRRYEGFQVATAAFDFEDDHTVTGTRT